MCLMIMVKRKTLEEFKKQLLEINPQIEIIGNYINNKTPIQCKCLKCGHVWEARPDNLLHWGCPNCRLVIIGDKNRKSITDVLREFVKIHGDKYDYSKVVYKNTDTKICIICPEHSEFWQTPSNHRTGHGCPKCANKILSEKYTSTTEEFIEKAKKVHGNLYDYSNMNYISAKIPISIICPKHGEFSQKPNVHLNGCGCPKCNTSKGEILIETVLKENTIQYISQFKLKIDSKINSSGYAFIDFYLPDYNTFIEYNGEQHYIPIKHFGGELKFQKQQMRDEYVRTYAKEHNIKLVEIPYSLNKDGIINLILNSI